MSDIDKTSITFPAGDGWSLRGTLLEPQGAARLGVLISSGTGFPRRYYRPVGEHFARRGAMVLIYDYRGIGGSAGDDLGGSGIDLTDWGRHDMPAALEALAAAAPDVPLVHLAHSVGGQFVGLMPNHERLARHAFVAVGSGYWGRHHLRNIPLELYFWWILGPISLLRWGYLKPVGGWRGTALPPGVFRTWRRWSHRRGYYRRDLAKALRPHFFDEIRAPICSWLFEDDPIATPRSAADIMRCYPLTPQELVTRAPADLGVQRIGHEGAFKPGLEALWDEWWRWLAQDA